MKRVELAPVKPYTTKQLVALYGVPDRTFRRWLKPFSAEIGERNGHFFSVKQIQVIFDKLGEPNTSTP